LSNNGQTNTRKVISSSIEYYNLYEKNQKNNPVTAPKKVDVNVFYVACLGTEKFRAKTIPYVKRKENSSYFIRNINSCRGQTVMSVVSSFLDST
jgi:hypothetical protein